MSRWLSRRLRLDALSRHADLSERATVLALGARFVDEFASGAVLVLLPTLRRHAGLSVAQVGLALQAVDLVGGLVDPVAGFAVDLWRRRPLLVAGALGWAAALLLVGGVPTFAGLLLAFACIGAASGALAHTADVILVEGHPGAAERISTLATVVDTVGALLAPLSVALLFRVGASGRPLLLSSGLLVAVYAVLLARTTFPGPSAAPRPGRRVPHRLPHDVIERLRRVVGDRESRRWLEVLVLDGIVDVAIGYEPLWLADAAGLGQSLVGFHLTLELTASLAALLVLDRLLRRWDAVTVLRWSVVLLAVTWAAWLLVGTTAARFLLVVPRSAVAAPIWPIARARALSSAPGNAGTVGSVLSISALLPVTAAFGWASEVFGFTTTMLVVPSMAFAGMLLLVRPHD